MHAASPCPAPAPASPSALIINQPGHEFDQRVVVPVRYRRSLAMVHVYDEVYAFVPQACLQVVPGGAACR